MVKFCFRGQLDQFCPNHKLDRLLMEVNNYEKARIAELRSAVLAVASSLRFNFPAVRYRCTSAWVSRVREMSEAALAREMRFFFNRKGLRWLVHLFRVFGHSDVVVSFIGENIERRGIYSALLFFTFKI